MMKILIAADMEGITGVVHPLQRITSGKKKSKELFNTAAITPC